MSTWTEEELRAVGTATELRISTRRHDGTLSPPLPVWVVRAGDDIYVRSYKGAGGAWFRRVSALGRAHSRGADVDRDVTVSLMGTAARAEIDEAYRTKYAPYGRAYVEPMTADAAAATTLLLTPSPREDDDHDNQ
jgi:hypothetical protein